MTEWKRLALLLLQATSFGFGYGQPNTESTPATVARLGSTTPTRVETNIQDSNTINSSRTINATCVSGTVNYITHTLPQQCLRTDRISSNATLRDPTNLQVTFPIAAAATTPDATLSLNTAVSSGSANDGSEPPVTGTGDTSSMTSLEATSSATVTAAEVTATIHATEVEADPLLDASSFLSFEEWKKQNLARAGQSPEHVGQDPVDVQRRERPDMAKALEGLGDEGEIDLDFSGFGQGPDREHQSSLEKRPTSATDYDSPAPSRPRSNAVPAKLRNKDAGTTCKERNNYASFDCGANILKTNPQCKHASSVLIESKDSYMLNTCSADNKFLIVQLCSDIHIDTVVLANYEFFSSNFRHFRVSVSDRYPIKLDKWKELGTFEARNTREVQAFLVEDPQIWARYLRIEFLTHYGSEYYCPVSLLRVHGKTMMQEFRQEEELARGEIADDESVFETDAVEPAVAQEPLSATEEPHKVIMEVGNPVPTTAAAPSEPTSVRIDTMARSETESHSGETFSDLSDTFSPAVPTCPASDSVGAPGPTSILTGSEEVSAAGKVAEYRPVRSTSALPNNPGASSSDDNSMRPKSDDVKLLGSTSVTNSSATLSGSTGSEKAADSLSAAPKPQADGAHSVSGSSSTAVSSVAASVNGTRSSTASSSPQASSQESFFKSISKRLQQLESNSTLSLQYIEEQSRILREAFNKVEKRQIVTTSSFLSQLNATVTTELQGFRQAYDQLWQSTVIELENQREQYQREMLALSSRLTMVADELVWQKRMGIVQSTLLLLCLGLVLFARQGTGYLDMTLAQQLMSRSQAALKGGWESEPNSPSPVSRSRVAMLRRKVWRSGLARDSRQDSDEAETRPQTRDGGLVEGHDDAGIVKADGNGSDCDQTDDEEEANVNLPDPEPENLVRSVSSPAVPEAHLVKAEHGEEPDGRIPMADEGTDAA